MLERDKVNIEKMIGHCSHKDCIQCKNLKVDLDVIGGIIKFATAPDEPEHGTDAVAGRPGFF